VKFNIDIAFGEKCEVYTSHKKIIKKYGLSEDDFRNIDGRALILEKNGNTKFVMYIGTDTYKTIAHESSHIADYTSEFFGIDDDEFKAYLIGHLVDQIIYKIRELTK